MYDSLQAAISSGVPVAIRSPPLWPPSGPRSMTWSAVLITSRLCSITTTEWPLSTRRFRLSQQPIDVGEVQSRRRLVEDVQVVLAALELAELAGELDPLGFAAGEDRRRVAELEVAEAEFVQDGDLAGDGRLGPRRTRRHPRSDRSRTSAMFLPLVFDLERVLVVAGSLAGGAEDFHVGHERELRRDRSFAARIPRSGRL